MEAATPLRRPRVTTDERCLHVHDLTVEDETAARVVRERGEAGEDPADALCDAIEIGARVLDRESVGAQADFVKAEFERASKDVESAFTEKARTVAEHFGEKVDEVFDPDTGQLSRSLDELFSEGSASAVQHRVRELVAQTMQQARDDLLRQFSAADGRNPLADFKQGALDAINQASKRQSDTSNLLLAKLGELDKQVQALHAEKRRLEELAEERERGTAKGRSFEERVAEVLDAIAVPQGDCAEPVGDVKGATGKTGDVVVDLCASDGPPRGRVVFEAKDSRLSRPEALRELDRALAEREADFAVLVVPSEEHVPARMHALREYNGDKLIVTLADEDEDQLALELGYRLARARVLMKRAAGEGVDAGAVRDTVERARLAMEDVRRVKQQLTGAKTSIDNAREIVEGIAERVRSHLDEVERLVGDGAGRASQATLDV